MVKALKRAVPDPFERGQAVMHRTRRSFGSVFNTIAGQTINVLYEGQGKRLSPELPGDLAPVNKNRQADMGDAGVAGNHPFARMRRMICGHCWAEYGANSCDTHIRLCPLCQEGKPGLTLP